MNINRRQYGSMPKQSVGKNDATDTLTIDYTTITKYHRTV